MSRLHGQRQHTNNVKQSNAKQNKKEPVESVPAQEEVMTLLTRRSEAAVEPPVVLRAFISDMNMLSAFLYASMKAKSYFPLLGNTSR